MATISLPDITANIVTNQTVTSNAPQKVLMIGQGVGTVDANTLTENIPNDNSENTLFGRRNMLSVMIRAFKSINNVSQLDVINLDEPSTGGVAATATITPSNTATSSGNIVFAIQSEFLHKFTVGVSVGDTVETVATEINTVISEDLDLTVTSSVSNDIVTLTAVNEGEEANNITVRVIEDNTGVDLAITNFTGGAGAVTLPDIESLIGDTRYQGIVVPASYDLDTIKSFINDRYNVDNDILDGVVCITDTDTSSNLITLASTINSQSIILNGNKTVSNTSHRGGAIVEYNPSLSAMFMGYRALKHTEGADIAKYKIGNSIDNTTGGVAQTSSPDHNSPFYNIATIANNSGWTRVEQGQLNDGGVFFFGNNPSKSYIILGNVVTTYLTNAQGLTDETFKYLNAVDVASAIREFIVNNNRLQYSQSTLTNGDIVGKSMANADSIRAYNIGLYSIMSNDNYLLTQAGSDAKKYFANNLSVTITDLANGQAMVVQSIPMVSQLRGINMTLDVGFDI